MVAIVVQRVQGGITDLKYILGKLSTGVTGEAKSTSVVQLSYIGFILAWLKVM